ncbi:NADH:ubiquinone oxidoreductase [Photobacterium carnosum]|uniref:NADH:ubiquinone oxidoreductase n=1 Tax=Photobacterium carnosum TaxID=2023717 RepID=UPI001E2A510A|nr:NADH:ubiquinone oxidoreductase [Photobacterium carnosum]MCD9537257.1 NADH:ubiquinone oxidoreductase [Photobacterium carnosum]MCF2161802.1 NADH:ubiquinone oxidoreductase [Photobacterium carnosum]
MIFGLIILLSIVAGILSGEHFHSFMAGFGIAAVAIGTAYWLAFRATRYPQLALLMLLVAMIAKLGITVTGVVLVIKTNLISSPFIFSLSYLFFSIVVSYGYFKLREYQMSVAEKRNTVVSATAIKRTATLIAPTTTTPQI